MNRTGWRTGVVLCGAVVAGMIGVAAGEEASPPKSFKGLPLVFFDDFESGEAKRWEPTDPEAWKVTDQNGNHVYAITKRQSNYRPPHRSPYNMALVRDVTAGSFVLDVKLQSTLDTGAHRDLCLFFGHQGPDRFYYVHIAKKMDPHANNIFIVNRADRKSISETTTDGTDWTDDWHHARIVRDAKSGRIEVYFDDMDKPIMTATDDTFAWGRVGIGSFDDLGNFDDVTLYGEKVEPPAEK